MSIVAKATGKCSTSYIWPASGKPPRPLGRRASWAAPGLLLGLLLSPSSADGISRTIWGRRLRTWNLRGGRRLRLEKPFLPKGRWPGKDSERLRLRLEKPFLAKLDGRELSLHLLLLSSFAFSSTSSSSLDSPARAKKAQETTGLDRKMPQPESRHPGLFESSQATSC